MKYLRKFNTAEEYQDYYTRYLENYFTIGRGNDIRPNVSYDSNGDVVHLNNIENRLVVSLNVPDGSVSYQILNGVSLANSVEIDGVMLDPIVSAYTFGTSGAHTIKYDLKNNTSISNNQLLNKNLYKYIYIPDSFTTLGWACFKDCKVERAIIGKNVSTIAGWAFAWTNLNYLVIHNPNPPSIVPSSDSSWSIGDRVDIYVPKDAVETYKNAANWTSYASKIHPIPE